MPTTNSTPTLINMIATVKSQFGSLQSIPSKFVEPLFSLLDAADQLTLETIAAEQIKFMWIPAIQRLVDRYGYTWEEGLLLSNTPAQ